CYTSMSSFFFSSRRRHTRFSRDWSSDVCSSDLFGFIDVLFTFKASITPRGFYLYFISMSLVDFFTPIIVQDFCSGTDFYNSQFGKIIAAFEESFLDLQDAEKKPLIALIGVEEERASANNGGAMKSPSAVRKNFYNVYEGNYELRMTDLGNKHAGTTILDTCAALWPLVEELEKQDIFPLIIGGGQDLTFALYRLYEGLP